MLIYIQNPNIFLHQNWLLIFPDFLASDCRGQTWPRRPNCRFRIAITRNIKSLFLFHIAFFIYRWYSFIKLFFIRYSCVDLNLKTLASGWVITCTFKANLYFKKFKLWSFFKCVIFANRYIPKCLLIDLISLFNL